jgi:hypothetical protein
MDRGMSTPIGKERCLWAGRMNADAGKGKVAASRIVILGVKVSVLRRIC